MGISWDTRRALIRINGKDPAEELIEEVENAGPSGAEWGHVTGDMANQLDLTAALAGKAPGIIDPGSNALILTGPAATIMTVESGHGVLVASDSGADMAWSDYTGPEGYASTITCNPYIYIYSTGHVDIMSDGGTGYGGPNNIASSLGAAATDTCNAVGSTLLESEIHDDAVMFEVRSRVFSGGEPGVKFFTVKKGGVSAPNLSGTNTGDNVPADPTHTGTVTTLAQSFAGAKRCEPVSLTSTGGSIAIDLDASNNYTHTTTEASTLAAPSNPVAGQSGAIVITQGATPRTLAFNGFWKWAGGTAGTLTASVGAVDVLTYYVISPTMAICNLINNVS